MFHVYNFRQQFPGLLHRPGAVFLDGPAGTQVPRRVIDAVVHYFTHCNANHGGVFATSRESDEILHRAHKAMAELLNAPSPDEIVFGQNMTSLTLHFTRAVAKTLRPGDEVMVTRLDHDANVSPWVLAAQDAGATVRWVDINAPECTLDLDGLRSQLNDRTRWVAVGCASNAAGTINDVATITRLRTRPGPRFSSMPSTTRRMGRWTCKHGAAMRWAARRTSSSVLTLACCRRGASCWRHCLSTSCVPPRTRCPAAG